MREVQARPVAEKNRKNREVGTPHQPANNSRADEMSYPGSKAQAGVFQTIIGNMPPHSVYVEAFAGSAQVFHRKARAKWSGLFERCGAQAAKLVDELPGDWGNLRSDGLAFRGSVTVWNCDAIEWLPKLQLPADAVVYCDPPYPLDTRQGRLYYDHELSDDDHTRFLTLLQALKCRVMISGVHCQLYDWHLRDWRCVSYRVRWHRKTVTECLWCNFPEPTELHDWRYAGRNFRQRTSLKRLASRWLAKLDRMKPLQRGYVLDSIEQRHFRRSDPRADSDTDTGRNATSDVSGRSNF